jgi:rhodanese-related sulfurtransferase
VRARYQALPVDKDLVLVCNSGTRSFEVQSFLDSVGLKRSLVMIGGLNVVKKIGVDWYPE